MKIALVVLGLLGACGGDDQAPAADCHDDASVCGDHATCTDAGCVCGDGYIGDATSGCTDVDECAAGTARCDPGNTCVNTDGSFTCTPPAAQFVALAAGGRSACALRDDHTLWCWGSLSAGAAPVQIDGSDWLSIAVSDEDACGLHTDGTLWCWGTNRLGQLGTGDTASHAAPVQIGTATYSEVAIGALGTCAIDATDRTLACWAGGLPYVPTQIGTATWTHIAVGAGYQCGIQTDGKVYCWGANGDDQLGLGVGVGPSVATPTLVDSSDGWTAIAASAAVTCAVRGDEPFCWGGVGLSGGGPSTSPVGWSTPDVVTLSQATTISVGASVGCATAPDGLWCWGDDEHAQLGDGDDGFTHQDGPHRISPNAYVAVAVGDAFGCAIDAAGHQVRCWGSNAYGALGLGTTPAHLAPVQVGGATDWGAIGEIDDTACALHADTHVVECWGKHGNGDATPVHHQVPAPLYGGLDVVAFGLLADGGCAIDTGAALWCWAGGADPRTITQLGTDTTWTALASGPAYGHDCGIRTGALYCWGSNTHGELGVGTTDATTHAPTRVGPAADWSNVVVRDLHACGLRGGALYCWGDGYGTSPVQVGSAIDWTSLSASSSYDVGLRGGAASTFSVDGSAPYAPSITDWQTIGWDAGIRMDGTLWTWLTPASPMQVGSDTDWGELAGEGERCARKRDGTLWCFGFGEGDDGAYGQGEAWRSTPTPVVGLPQ